MADRFDVVATRIEDEGPKIGRMALGPKPGTTVVAPAAMAAASARNGRSAFTSDPEERSNAA
jgi:hypothetical protein